MSSQATTTFGSSLYTSNPLLSNHHQNSNISPAKSLNSGAIKNATLLPSPSESAAVLPRPNSLLLNENDHSTFNHYHHNNPSVLFTGGTPGSQSVHSFQQTNFTFNDSNLPSAFRPPLTRMPSVPVGGAGGSGLDANFWQMLFDVRSRSLARAKLKQSSQVSALLSGFALVSNKKF